MINVDLMKFEALIKVSMILFNNILSDKIYTILYISLIYR